MVDGRLAIAVSLLLVAVSVLLFAQRRPGLASCLRGPVASSQAAAGSFNLAVAAAPSTTSLARATSTTTTSTTVAATTTTSTSPAAVHGASPAGAADGCFNVFIDAGANVGVHGRFLFEPEKYPLSHMSRTVFDKEIGSVADRRENTCVFAFEPNPAHAEHQHLTETMYAAMGWKYVYMAMGVGRKNESMKFYRNANVASGAQNEEWGFGNINREQRVSSQRVPAQKVSQHSPAAYTTLAPQKPVVVPILDFSDWLHRVVFKRQMPTAPKPSWGKPKVIIKMDIEGMEVGLIPHMLTEGVLCKIDFFFGEVHNRPDFGPYKLQNGVVIQSAQAQAWMDGINRILTADGCRSTVRAIDDESYVHDGQPYPSPPPSR